MTLNERKKTNGWRLPRGQYYRTIEYALGYWESINSTLTSCSKFKNNKVLAPFGKNSYGITLWLLVNTLVRLEIWFHGWSSLLLDHRGKRKWFCTHLSYIQEEFVDIYLGCSLLWTEQSVINFVNRVAFCGWNSCRNRYLSESSIPFSRQNLWPSSNYYSHYTHQHWSHFCCHQNPRHYYQSYCQPGHCHAEVPVLVCKKIFCVP